VLLVALSSATLAACDETDMPSGPTTTTGATVRIVFFGQTTRRADLPASAEACANGVGMTHIHPSWRNFEAIPLTAVPPDRYEITMSGVPIDRQVTFRINDQNYCDVNPTGAVRSNVTANDVALINNTTTPGNGLEPGFAMTVSRDGSISQ
jgi:hypothetical protein